MPRKSNAEIIGSNAYLPIELYTISHSMEWIRGAKREIRDDDGKLLNSERNFRTHISGTYTKEQAESLKSNMLKEGIKNIKLHKLVWNLPSKCPKCKNNGTPTIYHGKGTLRQSDLVNQIKRDELRLTYNHSKTKHKTCVIGTVTLETPLPEITLTKQLSEKKLYRVLGFKRRAGKYPLPKDFTLSN